MRHEVSSTDRWSGVVPNSGWTNLESVTVWKSGVGFVDASTELFTPLMAGSTVIVAGEEAASDPQLSVTSSPGYRCRIR